MFLLFKERENWGVEARPRRVPAKELDLKLFKVLFLKCLVT